MAAPPSPEPRTFNRANSVPPWEFSRVPSTPFRDRGISIASLSDLKDLSGGASVSFGELGKAGEAIIGAGSYGCDHKLTVSTYVPQLAGGEITAVFKQVLERDAGLYAPENGSSVFTPEFEWKKTVFNNDVTVHYDTEAFHVEVHNNTLQPGCAVSMRGGRAHDGLGNHRNFALLQAELRRKVVTGKVTVDVGDQDLVEVEATCGSQSVAVAAHASYNHAEKTRAWTKLFMHIAGKSASLFVTYQDHPSALYPLPCPYIFAHVHARVNDKTEVALASDKEGNWAAGACYQVDGASTLKGKLSGRAPSAAAASGASPGSPGGGLKVAANLARRLRPDLLLQLVAEVDLSRLSCLNSHRFGLQALVESI